MPFSAIRFRRGSRRGFICAGGVVLGCICVCAPVLLFPQRVRKRGPEFFTVKDEARPASAALRNSMPDDMFIRYSAERLAADCAVEPDELCGMIVCHGVSTVVKQPSRPVQPDRSACISQPSRALIWLSRTSSLKGLGRYSSAPCFKPQKRSLSWFLLLTIIILMSRVAGSLLSCRHT